MADLATPSAAAIGTMDATTDDVNKQQAGKPEKPDESVFKTAVEQARKALTTAQDATKAAQARVTSARPGNKDSPAAKRQQELRAQLGEIRTKQQGFKTTRMSTQDRMKALDTQLKNRILEQKNARAKMPFKNIEEVDQEINRLEAQVNAGTMKLVDEKKALADVSALRKQRKAFSGFDDSQKQIDEVKNQITELRKEMDNPEFKSLSDEYTKIQQELDSIKAEQDGAFKDLNANRDALTKARQTQDQKYTELKSIQDTYYNSLRAFRDYDREAARIRDQKRKAERDAYTMERKRKDLDRELEEASWPAYGEQLRACDNLLRILDPSYVKSSVSTGPSQFAAAAQRKVDDSDFKGTRLQAKKDAEEASYFVGTGGKKGKKGNKKPRDGTATPGTPTEGAASSSMGAKDLGRFFEPGVAQQFETVGLAPPSSQDEIAPLMEKIKEKKEEWTKTQDSKTKENIASVQKRIDALTSGTSDDTTTAATTTTTTTRPTTTNGVSYTTASLTADPTAAPGAAAAEDDEVAEIDAYAEDDVQPSTADTDAEMIAAKMANANLEEAVVHPVKTQEQVGEATNGENPHVE